MSSKRDRLRQANAANEATRGNTSTDDTIFADFINRGEEMASEEIMEEAGEIISVGQIIPPVKTDIPENNLAENLSGDVNVEKISEENTNDISAENAEEKSDVNDANRERMAYSSRTKPLTVCMPEETYQYLYKRAIKEGTNCTKLLQKLLKDEMYLGHFEDDELAEKCRKRQHDVMTKGFIYDEIFVDEVKKKAQEYLMRPTHFVRYCIEKSRKA